MGGIASFFTPEPMPRASADHDYIHEMLEAIDLVREGVASAEEIKLAANVAEGVLHGGARVRATRILGFFCRLPIEP
jgi:hypothetical protein